MDDRKYSLVSTSRTKYFGEVKEGENKTVISNSIELTDKNSEELALEYVKAIIMGKAKEVTISNTLLESITELPEETLTISTLLVLLPIAREEAIGIITFIQLKNLFERKI